MNHAKVFKQSGWKSVYRRGELIVEFKKDLGFGFRVCVSPNGKDEHPFPAKEDEVHHWYYYVWTPGAKSARCFGRFKTPEAAMRAGEIKAHKVLHKAVAHLLKVMKSLE